MRTGSRQDLVKELSRRGEEGWFGPGWRGIRETRCLTPLGDGWMVQFVSPEALYEVGEELKNDVGTNDKNVCGRLRLGWMRI